jgi:hypothetical protein
MHSQGRNIRQGASRLWEPLAKDWLVRLYGVVELL